MFNMIELGNLCDLQNGFAFKSKDYIKQSNTLNFRMSNIRPDGKVDIDYNPKYLPDDYAIKYSKYILNDDDVVIAMTDMASDPKILGVPTVVKTKGKKLLLNQRVGRLVIKEKEKIFLPYLKYALNRQQVKNYFKSFAGGGLQLNIGKEDILKAQIPLPPIQTQKKIVEVLDKAQACIDYRKEQLKLLDDLLQTTFYEMFGDTVTNSKGWEVKKLKNMSTKILSGNTPKGGKQVYVEEGIVFFRSQNVWRNRLELDNVAYIDKKTHDKMRNSSLKNKDILMTKTGRINTENSSLGRAAMFLGEDDSANINGHVYLIRLQKSIVHEFVLFILTTDEYREYIRSVCVGGIDKRQINKEHLEEFPIINPPIELQKRFTEHLKYVDDIRVSMKLSLEKLENNYNSLMQRAFKGELI